MVQSEGDHDITLVSREALTFQYGVFRQIPGKMVTWVNWSASAKTFIESLLTPIEEFTKDIALLKFGLKPCVVEDGTLLFRIFL